jgi:hypothetical protein
MRPPRYLCVCVSSPIKFWMPELTFKEYGMCMTASESVLKAYFINPSQQSACVSPYHC